MKRVYGLSLCKAAVAALIGINTHAAADAPVLAKVELTPLFGAHAVLQRGPATGVWGTANPGEKVEVSVSSARATAITGTNGWWHAKLDLADVGERRTPSTAQVPRGPLCAILRILSLRGLKSVTAKASGAGLMRRLSMPQPSASGRTASPIPWRRATTGADWAQAICGTKAGSPSRLLRLKKGTQSR